MKRFISRNDLYYWGWSQWLIIKHSSGQYRKLLCADFLMLHLYIIKTLSLKRSKYSLIVTQNDFLITILHSYWPI